MQSLSTHPDDQQIERRLLQSVVAVARHVYGAAASSVFMVVPDTGELVFAAVAGEGEQDLVGTRFPAGTGIAGFVAASCQTMITDNVADSHQFAGDAASSTGYVPTSIMAAPLVADGECIGVLEVLDRHTSAGVDAARELDDMELLGLLATQAALGLALLGRRSGTTTRPMGTILARLAEHAAMDRTDPIATALLDVTLNLLESRTPIKSPS